MTTTSNRSVWTERCLDQMRASVSLLRSRAPLLGEMAEYHLGWSDGMNAQERYRGKMFRPLIAIHACEAVAGPGSGNLAIPLAAAIELLHNFTLIHDDIQDNSPARRHRPTVWAKWGEAQAINAGDALFAAAHLALLDSTGAGVPADTVIELLREFDATTIDIVSGQVLDLQFEQRTDVTSDEYIGMITGKTARIVEFAARGGARVGGAKPDLAGNLAAFGLALGIGFQVQDDLLGAFGAATDTGKAEADDIRRKKQTLPVLLLRQMADSGDRDYLTAVFSGGELGPDEVGKVLAMMSRYGIEQEVRTRVASYHDQAVSALSATALADEVIAPLLDLTRRLETRTG